MEKQGLLQKLNPLQLQPVLLLILALVFEILFETVLRFSAELGWITSQRFFLIALYSVQFLSKSTFFIIILYYKPYEKRYVLYSVFSIIALFMYAILSYHYRITGGGRSLAIDLNFIFSAAALFMAIYISVDSTVEFFVKPVLIIQSIILILFQSFFQYLWLVIAIESIGVTGDDYYAIATFLIIGLYHIVYLIWTIPQVILLKKIDYI